MCILYLHMLLYVYLVSKHTCYCMFILYLNTHVTVHVSCIYTCYCTCILYLHMLLCMYLVPTHVTIHEFSINILLCLYPIFTLCFVNLFLN